MFEARELLLRYIYIYAHVYVTVIEIIYNFIEGIKIYVFNSILNARRNVCSRNFSFFVFVFLISHKVELVDLYNMPPIEMREIAEITWSIQCKVKGKLHSMYRKNYRK